MPSSKKRSTHKNKKRRGQKVYKMKGCSTKKRYLGGGNVGISNAYPNTGNNAIPQGWITGQTGGSCSTCGMRMQSGGSNNGALVGGQWTSNPNTWSSVNGQNNSGNYYGQNTYNNDISRSMVDVGANPPFLQGGRRQRNKTNKNMRGGLNLSNTIGQDIVNLARQGITGLGNMANAFQGYSAAPSPMPWRNQLPNTLSSNALKTMKL